MNTARHFIRAGPAFTLVELVVSMVVVSILLAAMVGVVSLAGRAATGQGATDAANGSAAADAADQVADDLNVALSFSERTATSIAFTVPDRVGNGTPNQVRYAWVGTAGAPLTRQFCPANAPPLTAASTACPPATLLGNVSAVSLSPLFRTVGPATVTDAGIGSTITGLSGLTAGTRNIDDKNAVRETFTPSLPTGTTAYTLIRAVVQATAPPGPPGVIAVTVAGTTTAGAAVTETEPLYTGQLSSAAAQSASVAFRSMAGLNPAKPLTLTVGFVEGGPALGKVGTATFATSPGGILTGATYATCANAASGSPTWTSNATGCLMFAVYGTVP